MRDEAPESKYIRIAARGERQKLIPKAESFIWEIREMRHKIEHI